MWVVQKKSMELILELKKVEKTWKKLILPWWVKNEEKKLKNAYVQNLRIGLPLFRH